MRTAFSAVCVVSGLLAGVASPLVRADSPLGDLAMIEQLENTLAAVADEVRPSVVAIRADRRIEDFLQQEKDGRMPDDEMHRQLRDRLIPAVGSGIVIAAEGLILTNEHVIHNAEPEHIECTLANEQTYAVREITSDPRSDLAVLRIDAEGLTPAKLGEAEAVRQGHFAIAMGNPFGAASDNLGAPSMSFGIVSALGQELTQQLDPTENRYYGNLIQTDARINPGNSGGPLLNIRGEVIGINVAISTRSGGSEGVGYAIAVDRRTKDIIARLARGEEILYGFLGVGLETPTAEHRRAAGATETGGARVRQVHPGTPAYAAQLRTGDIIVRFDGKRVESVDHLVRLVGAAQVGTEVDLRLYRDQNLITVRVAPAPRDVASGVGILLWRGMKLRNLRPDVRETLQLSDTARGVVLLQVTEGSPAAKAGLTKGQVIRRIEDVEIESIAQLRDLTPRWEGPVRVTLDDPPATQLTLP